MPLGILDDNKLEHVPGTAPLSELGRLDLEFAGIDRGLLKYDATGKIVLVPQPSNSPNDPYNWPRWKKEMFTLVIAYGCGCVGAIGPLLTPASVPLAAQFGVPLQRFTLGCIGFCIVAIAVGSLLCNTIAVKVGKRPVYILTTLGLALSSFWAAEAKSFGSLAGSRVVLGFCMAPFEALIPASVSDIWHVHERGFRMAIFNLGVLGGINLAGPIAGSVIEKGSFRIAMHAIGGAMVLMLILVIFFMPESAFVRHDTINIDTSSKTVAIEEPAKEKTVRIENRLAVANTAYELRIPYIQELKPWSGYFDHVSFWRTLIRPFVLILSPIVMWATLLFTTCISWLVLISITLSQIFSAPPYNFSISAVGATNVSSFVASVLATLVAGYVVDGVATWMSKHNNGVFEPEFRLPVMITYLIFTATGFFAWGDSLYKQDPWPIPVVVCLGLINLGVQLGTTSVVTYVSDCHREQSAEAFAIMNFIKNMFAFGLTFYANDWIAVQGVRDSFFVIGGTTVAVTVTTIPMYIWGKRARSWVFRYRVLDRVLKKAR